jgi:radical SAM superfamily enzyme YgiQ (UPF0313 family)
MQDTNPKSDDVKLMLITTPIRPVAGSFPPIGSLSIISYLRKHGIETDFYHIDGIRPEFDAAVRHIVESKPDVLAVSAVVSTAYAYTKKLVLAVKAQLPDVLVIVGGSLSASAEVLLRRAGVDLCATGEGERVMVNVVERARSTRRPADFADIPGLVLLDSKGDLVNTGFEAQLGKEEIYDVDWSDLENAADISTYIYPLEIDGEMDPWFQSDPRAFEPHRAGKTVVQLPGAKGCVAKCTFCHRWDKGIRYIPTELIERRLKNLIQNYNVGFVIISDENFGTDKKWLAAFCEMIKPYDVLWHVSGMRVNCIDPERIQMMKDAGCTAIVYGMETGSERMLQVMEKKVKLKDNYNAMKWTIEARLRTIVQLVIGMPGEDTDSIDDTAKFAAYANTLSPDQKPWDLSINFAQALPGTPLYEYARRVGLIGQSLDAEEEYLMQVSDRDASDESCTLNFTGKPFFIHRSWRHRIQIQVLAAYVKKFGKKRYAAMLANDTRHFERSKSEESGYFNEPKREVERAMAVDSVHGVRQTETLEDEGRLPSLASLLLRRRLGLSILCYPEVYRAFLWVLPLLWILVSIRTIGAKATARDVVGQVFSLKPNGRDTLNKSLRKIVFEDMGVMPGDSLAMEPLRRGR